MRTEGIVRQVEDAFHTYGTPAIFNSGQGSQFTDKLYCELLSSYHVLQSMDGRGRWKDNVDIERWFRSLKHEGLRSQEYTSPRELYRVIDDYVYHYNNLHPHESLGYDCPAQWYYSGLMAA